MRALELGAAELAALADALRRAEGRINTVFVRAPDALTGDDISALQDIDRIIQTIDALSNFFTELAERKEGVVESNWDAALDSIPLVDLRMRMNGVETTTSAASMRSVPDLF
jgi:hypothetical protein